MRLVAIACIFQALHISFQRIKTRTRKRQVMGCRRPLVKIDDYWMPHFIFDILHSSLWILHTCLHIQGWTEYKMLYIVFNPPPLQPKRIIIETSNLAWIVTMGIVSDSSRRFSISAPWAEIWGWGGVPLGRGKMSKIFFSIFLIFLFPLVGSSSATT